MEESIENFIKRKNKFTESREGHNLHVFDRLVTIDGVDGSGKDTISEYLLKKMKERFGEENVIQIDVTHFKDNEGRVTGLGERVFGDNGQDGYFNVRNGAKKINNQELFDLKDQQIDKAFIAGVNRAYTEKVIPALESGKIVIIPRSELNLLRFALQENNKEKIDREIKYLLDGTTTSGIIAGNRIFVHVNPVDMLRNIEMRGNRTDLDPKDIQDAETFVKTQSEAEDFFTGLSSDKEVNFIRVENNTVDTKDIKNHMEKLCENIINSLVLE